MNIFDIRLMRSESVSPIIVGKRKANSVALLLFVSLYIVIRVVEQGKWKRAKAIVHITVTKFQPQEENSSII